ncbi:MAG: citrate synthase [[Clostridium] spiroforme]|uniref:Citrate synthase n=1 Tax=Thomasclavelia spiroformis TaxID=29348 RepID=A0A943EKG3_9FIRM|nr:MULTISPECIES: citrate synthase [Thomasclavelia]MBS5588076.1 citrate synthase [Thomasclavelia spiroformis]
MSEFINGFLKKVRKDEYRIDNELYSKYDVKKGLRNEDGTGVLVGLTKISDVVGYKRVDGKKIDCHGELYYRGINVSDIINKRKSHQRFLFEETCFLILFGYLPDEEELNKFKDEMSKYYELPPNYLESKILGFPSKNLMNKLQQEVLMLYSYDDDPDNVSPKEMMYKGLNLIAKIPLIVCYAYRSKVHYFDKESLYIHQIRYDLSIAENILYLLRDNKQFTQKEAEVLDMCLVLHADHGGGNNSTFTNVVISSTGTDIYSSFAGAIGSLKGPKHGGANLAVMQQMLLAIDEIGIEATDQAIENIVNKILDKQFNDKSGLIYGIGHAVYTISDPRCVILRQQCKELAKEKGRDKEFDFYYRFEQAAIKAIKKRKGITVCANVDFYSGLIYDMLSIPRELYTLMFVVARTVGWLAHNIENKLYSGRIIRPAAKYVGETHEYVPLDKRK